ncbi:hypothetical protein ANCCAN_07741 [Ancylostoma caninum]|uniref:Uncharacterized protein n=1 Tax=Ancylostoma caninum TaxID=29170 RepID=A0A368GPB3_ANCCA|nr:hypothetical protein ANCCAN_07741 [Ancylostoma caninum]
MLKVKQGRLLHTIIHTMRQQRQEYDAHGHIKKKKFTAYSVEDWLMQAFLSAIGAADKVLGDKIPDYNSMIIIELKKTPAWSVQVFYKKDRNQGAVDITQHVRGCKSSPCPYEYFLWCCDDYITEDVSKACAEEYYGNQYNH